MVERGEVRTERGEQLVLLVLLLSRRALRLLGGLRASCHHHAADRLQVDGLAPWDAPRARPGDQVADRLWRLSVLSKSVVHVSRQRQRVEET